MGDDATDGSAFDDLRRDAEAGLQEARKELDTLGGADPAPEIESRASRVATGSGRFEGEVMTRWERDPDRKDRTMTLLADFAYVDPKGKRWLAAAGRKVDGASIPAPLWADWLGAPFVGDFRRATVIHDIGCEDKTETHKAVHRVFYDACRCDGVSQTKALLLYAAVRIGGPKWGAEGRRSATAPSAERLDAIKRDIESAGDDMTIDDVEHMLDSALGE